jgi:hypothetical protein
MASMAFAAVRFRSGAYASPSGGTVHVSFKVVKRKVTKLTVSALLAECSGPLARKIAGQAYAFGSGLKARVRRDGSFSVAIAVRASVVTGTLTGHLRGGRASGTLLLNQRYDNTPLPNVLGLNTCTTGNLQWTAARR